MPSNLALISKRRHEGSAVRSMVPVEIEILVGQAIVSGHGVRHARHHGQGCVIQCKGLISWAISSGNSGDVDLSGRKVVLALYAPGSMIEGNCRVALYVDDGADGAQMMAVLLASPRGVEPLFPA